MPLTTNWFALNLNLKKNDFLLKTNLTPHSKTIPTACHNSPRSHWNLNYGERNHQECLKESPNGFRNQIHDVVDSQILCDGNFVDNGKLVKIGWEMNIIYINLLKVNLL